MAKGGAYERDLCKKLSLWWSKGIHDDLFWRTAGSGGRATVRGRKGQQTRGHCGDICNTDSEGEPLIKAVAIECKRGYSKHTIADLLDCPTTSAIQEYEKWFEQAETSKVNSGALSWILIHKRDQRDPLIFMPCDLWCDLEDVGAMYECLPSPFLQITSSYRKKDKTTNRETIMGFHLDFFLNGTTKEHILKILSQGTSEVKDE